MENEISVDVIPDKVRINVWITRSQYEAMSTLSSIDNRTLSDVIREAARDYIMRHQERLQPRKGL